MGISNQTLQFYTGLDILPLRFHKSRFAFSLLK
jgi:hypothetical protein